MIKRILPLALVLLLACSALAEMKVDLVTPTPGPGSTPAPTPEPEGSAVELEGLKLTLPEQLTLIESTALEGYAAALESDYSGTAQLLAAATDATNVRAVLLARCMTAGDAKALAQDAAQRLLGDAALVSERSYGENTYQAFACAIGETVYQLYYTTLAEQVYIVGTSGLSDAEHELLLSSLAQA